MVAQRAFLILACTTTFLLGASQEVMQRSRSAKVVTSALVDTVNGVPRWVLSGILYRETKSSYRQDGSILYVDQTTGSSGEVGAFQLTPIARAQVEKFYKLPRRSDKELMSPWMSEFYATKYLMWLHNYCADKSWDMTVRMYNAGPTGPIFARVVSSYLYDVKAFK